MLMEEALERYFRSCQARQLGSNTLASYRFNLSTFRKWWAFQRADMDSSTLDVNLLEDYMTYLLELDSVSLKTKANRMKDLRTFVRWGQDKNYFPAKLKVVMFKPQEAEIESLSDTDLYNIYETCLLNRTLDRIRDYALMRLLEETGMRIGECLNLKVADLDMRAGIINLKLTKNKKNRNVYLTPGIKRDLVVYIDARRRFLGQHEMITDALWITLRAGAHGSQVGEPLKERTIQDRINKFGKAAGVSKRVSPHTFRHTFARNFIVNGGNMYVLKELLGHSTLDMVLRYLALWDTDKQSAYQAVMVTRDKARRKEKLPRIKI